MPNTVSSIFRTAPYFDSWETRTLVKAARSAAPQLKQATDTNATTTLANVTELLFRVKKNRKYLISGQWVTPSTAGAGFKLQFNLVGSVVTPTGQVVLSGASSIGGAMAAFNAPLALALAGAGNLLEFQGYFVSDVSGILTCQFAQQTATGSTAVNPGSIMNVSELPVSRRSPWPSV